MSDIVLSSDSALPQTIDASTKSTFSRTLRLDGSQPLRKALVYVFHRTQQFHLLEGEPMPIVDASTRTVRLELKAEDLIYPGLFEVHVMAENIDGTMQQYPGQETLRINVTGETRRYELGMLTRAVEEAMNFRNQAETFSRQKVDGTVLQQSSLPQAIGRDGEIWFVTDERQYYQSDGSAWSVVAFAAFSETNLKFNNVSELGTRNNPNKLPVYVRGKRGGFFDAVDNDPYGNGEDGGVVFAGPEQGPDWYMRRFDYFVSAQWFGATGNGVTDDTEAIQSAYDFAASLQASKGHVVAVYLPSGVYIIENPPIQLTNRRVSLVGDSLKSVRLKCPSLNTDLLQVAHDVDYMSIENMTLDGGAYDRSATGIHFLNGDGGNHNIDIRNIECWNVAKGIWANGVWLTRVINVRVNGAFRAFHFENGYTTIYFTNCYANTPTVGFTLKGIDSAVFNTCAVDSATRDRWDLQNGTFVLNACHAEFDTHIGERGVVHLQGPATAVINGLVTYQVGNADGETEADLSWIWLDAEDGVVHASVKGLRNEQPKTSVGTTRRYKITGANAANCRLDLEANHWNGLEGRSEINEATVGGVGTESANAEEPTAANWEPGDVVNFTDTGDGSGDGTYMLNRDGSTWLRLA